MEWQEGNKQEVSAKVSNACAFSAKYFLYELYDSLQINISNKEALPVHEYKTEPEYFEGSGWYRGYGFKHFWSNCYALLGEIGSAGGMQQLCHQYYLQNGSLGAFITVSRIKRFLGLSL